MTRLEENLIYFIINLKKSEFFQGLGSHEEEKITIYIEK